MNTQWRRRRRDLIEPPRRSEDTSLTTALLALAAGALLTVTTGLYLMQALEQAVPSIGGIIVFKPDAAATERWSVNAVMIEPGRLGVARDARSRHCRLSPGSMADHGGSL